MSEQLNVERVKDALAACCRSGIECSSCQGKACLIGFAKLVADYAGVKKTLAIPGGIKMVPAGDFKVYDADSVAQALAVINIECRNCLDNHDDNCVINIIRSCLEVALFGQHVAFTGNPLAYLARLIELDAENGNKVMAAYRALKKAAAPGSGA